MHSKQPQAVIGFSMMEYMDTSGTAPCEPILAYSFVPVPVAFLEIDQFAQLDGLVGAGRVDAEGCFAVQPVVGAAQTETFGRDHADMVRREGLAQSAGVELIYFVIGQVGQALVAEVVGFAGCFPATLRAVSVR